MSTSSTLLKTGNKTCLLTLPIPEPQSKAQPVPALPGPQGNFFQQVEVALKEVIANGFVKDKRHAMTTEFIVGLLPAGSKGKMGSQMGHGEVGNSNYSCRERKLVWLLL